MAFSMDEEKDKIGKDKPGSAFTRREWLISLGSAIAFSGIPVTPEQAGRQPHAGAALPPGLYQPSFDHLSHALNGEGRFLPVPAGTETEYLRPRTSQFVPQAFAPQEFAVIRRLVEIILGEDLKSSPEQPGRGGPASLYDEVAEWIDLAVASAPDIRAAARNLPADQRALAVTYFGSEEPVRELETFEPERVCREGLAWLGEESQRRFAKSFLDAGPAAQLELIQAISDARPDLTTVHAGTRLFDFLKAESIRGFYTSRAGLKELDYKGNAFYSKSPGCGPATGSPTTTGKAE
jgi:gluconate 2-dehydrogenase subunit 3-like protein